MQILYKLKKLFLKCPHDVVLGVENSISVKHSSHVNDMSKNDLKKLLDFVKLEENYRQKKFITLLLTIAMIVGLFFFSQLISLDAYHGAENDKRVNNSIEEEKLRNNKNAMFVAFKRKRREFEKHIERGDKLAQNIYLYKALEEYQKAQVLFPEAYKVNFRITYTSTEICKRYKSRCREAHKLILKLQKKYPHREEVQELNKQISMRL
ncbi:hypothetical protein NBRC110019_20240 [Neptunitalea chrysea]|uniref:Tetratricopeptide repeat protein n=1 Tax=Neptunitalea chrysea TaxID=1647581 RepID=A0A9W6EUT4_9FLAO|nr:hypothetical protein [Neptunitalea chrysea]GLB52984.1 hypothetical protein NBRC110019_20240 [Neptunitalea chrysea]